MKPLIPFGKEETIALETEEEKQTTTSQSPA
jgi:hypothetical protein